MKVVLFQSVDNLGSAGEVVDVKPGYYRNYLGPRGYAKVANRANLALMESRRKKIEAMVAHERSEASKSAEDIQGTELTFELRSNDRGQLFGSVSTTDIAKALGEKGFEVDRRKIELSEAIKSLGTFGARIRLYPGVYADVQVKVERYLTPQERAAFEEAEAKAQQEKEEREAAIGKEEAEGETAEAAEAAEEAVEQSAEAEVAEQAAEAEAVAEEGAEAEKTE